MKEIMVSRISSVRPTQTVTMQVLLLTNKTELCNTHTHTMSCRYEHSRAELVTSQPP